MFNLNESDRMAIVCNPILSIRINSHAPRRAAYSDAYVILIGFDS